MSKTRNIVRLALLLSLFMSGVATLGFFESCKTSRGINYQNETSSVLSVRSGDNQPFELAPGQSYGVATGEFDGKRRIQAHDMNGDLVFTRDVTWDELKEMDWTIHIGRN